MTSDDHPQATDEREAAVAARYGISREQARRVLAEHDRPGSSLDEMLDSLAHFFRAPS